MKKIETELKVSKASKVEMAYSHCAKFSSRTALGLVMIHKNWREWSTKITLAF